jgi:hypothetical protein
LKTQNTAKKTPKKSKKQRKTLADSFLSQLQPFQDWFQIKLDELYRFHTLFFPIPPALVFKNPKTAKKRQKTKKNLGRFVSKPTTTVPRLVPVRNQRSLSIAHITFSHTTCLGLQKPKKPRKKGKNQRKTWADSFLSQLQPFQDWFQLELNELFRFH